MKKEEETTIIEYYKNLDLADIKYFCEIDLIEKTENWKFIPGYENLYSASDLGRIKSLKFKGSKKHGILCQSESSKGYLQVNLCKDKIHTSKGVHILVCMAFLGHVPCGVTRVVDHKFQNIKDNRLIMLHVVTQRINTNQKHLKSTSEYVGVYFHKQHKKWCAAIRIENKKIHIGSYVDEKEAGEAYNTALKNWEELGIKPLNKTFKSQYKGVTLSASGNRWIAQITYQKKRINIGSYKTELEANNAFLKKYNELRGL